MSEPTPAFEAVMCDGIGPFSTIDYKRALLIFDRIHYLLPSETVPFVDVSGREETIVFLNRFRTSPLYSLYSFELDAATRSLVLDAAHADVSDSMIQNILQKIPEFRSIYTWRLVNSDADLGGGSSLSLPMSPTNLSLAHMALMNKFLLAVGQLGAVPIFGQPYVAELLAAKYRRALDALAASKELPTREALSNVRLTALGAALVRSFITDEALEAASEEEILEYKDKNRKAFLRFSFLLRTISEKLSEIPCTDEFSRELQSLLRTDLWKEKEELEEDLSAAWGDFGKNALKSLAGGALAVTILPLLGLQSFSFATLVATVGPWLTSELLDLLSKRQQAHRHGLYYLMGFQG